MSWQSIRSFKWGWWEFSNNYLLKSQEHNIGTDLRYILPGPALFEWSFLFHAFWISFRPHMNHDKKRTMTMPPSLNSTIVIWKSAYPFVALVAYVNISHTLSFNSLKCSEKSTASVLGWVWIVRGTKSIGILRRKPVTLSAAHTINRYYKQIQS